MKLKKYDIITTSRINNPHGIYALTAYHNGSIAFSLKATQDLKITTDSSISLFQDEENSLDWYLALDKENGLPVRGKKETHFYIIRTAITRELLKCQHSVYSACTYIINDIPFKHDGLSLYKLQFYKKHVRRLLENQVYERHAH